MKQVFVEGKLREGGRATLQGELYAHLARVARLKAGDALLLVDAAGSRFEAEVAALARGKMEAAVLKALPSQAPLPERVLGICLPSSDAFDAALDAAVQLGATELAPLDSARSQKAVKDKSARWERIVKEACCQSFRSVLPKVGPVRGFEAFAGEAPGFLFDPSGIPWKPGRGAAKRLLIGPEGGFEKAELDFARAKGWAVLSLGPGILRVPVAVAAALSLATLAEPS